MFLHGFRKIGKVRGEGKEESRHRATEDGNSLEETFHGLDLSAKVVGKGENGYVYDYPRKKRNTSND